MREAVVVGAGLAGLQAVVALRTGGYDGRLTLVGAESVPPYDRPPLSKAVLLGSRDDTTLEADWGALGVDLRLGVRATGMRPGRLETDTGPVNYDGLVIATGSRPRSLPGTERDASVITLRTSDDALRLRERLVMGGRVVIVGAGWIGAEVATAATAAGCETTVVEALPAPLAAALPESVGALTSGWYPAGGARLLLGKRVERIGGGAVRLSSGHDIAADVVVVGVGVRPETDWLRGSGIDLTDGGAVVVDGGLRTSIPHVVAAGDCAAWWSVRYNRRMHVEHWDNALRAPAAAAASLLGRAERYDPVPYFWSEQWGRMVQYAGNFDAADQIVERGDPRSDSAWAICGVAESRPVAMMTVDRPRDLVQGRRLMESGALVDLDLLADSQTPVKNCVLQT